MKKSDAAKRQGKKGGFSRLRKANMPLFLIFEFCILIASYTESIPGLLSEWAKR